MSATGSTGSLYVWHTIAQEGDRKHSTRYDRKQKADQDGSMRQEEKNRAGDWRGSRKQSARSDTGKGLKWHFGRV